MRKSIVFILNTACILLFVGCNNNQETQSETENKKERMTVTTRDVTLTTAYSATMRGRQDIAVFPQIESKIISLLVEEGQSVKTGQPLFVLNQVAQRAALNTAIANEHAALAALANARLTLAGKMKLYQKKIESAFTIAQTRNQVAQAKAQWEQAHAEVVNARNSLSYTVVRSPSVGVVGSIPHKVGSLVSPTMTKPLTYVSDNAVMVAYFSLNQDQLSSLLRKYGSKERALREMPPVTWQMNDGSLYDVKGKVKTISGLLDPTTGSVSVRAYFDNSKRLLLSGATGNVLMPTTFRNAVVIPQTVVSQLQDKLLVKKVVRGKTRLTEIKVYPQNDGKNYIVMSGLKAGDVIIKN